MLERFLSSKQPGYVAACSTVARNRYIIPKWFLSSRSTWPKIQDRSSLRDLKSHFHFNRVLHFNHTELQNFTRRWTARGLLRTGKLERHKIHRTKRYDIVLLSQILLTNKGIVKTKFLRLTFPFRSFRRPNFHALRSFVRCNTIAEGLINSSHRTARNSPLFSGIIERGFSFAYHPRSLFALANSLMIHAHRNGVTVRPVNGRSIWIFTLPVPIRSEL